MQIKNGENGIEVYVLFYSSEKIYGRTVSTNKDSRKYSQDNSSRKNTHRRNPEDNLGNVVAVLDVDKIERDVDFISVNEFINDYIKTHNCNIENIFDDEDTIYFICSRYDYTLKEFINELIEHYPDEVNLHFLKTVIKPFVLKLQKEKEQYDSSGSEGKSRPIFSVI